MALLPIPANSPDIGECIYCGSTEEPLRREHAVPYGLNGPWTLLRASCEDCADITHRFERDTLRNLFPHVRTILSFQTRRPHERPRLLPLVLESGGVQKTVQVPRAEFPLYLPTPRLPPPGVVAGRTPAPVLHVELEFIHLAGPIFEEVAARYPDVDFVGARLNFSPQDFGRTLAKIGLCAGVYVLGLAPLRSSPLRRVIHGEDPCIGHWVGSWTGAPFNEATGLHGMQVRTSGADVHVFVRLFGQFGGPEYHVVLGPADAQFVNSDAWPWK